MCITMADSRAGGGWATDAEMTASEQRGTSAAAAVATAAGYLLSLDLDSSEQRNLVFRFPTSRTVTLKPTMQM